MAEAVTYVSLFKTCFLEAFSWEHVAACLAEGHYWGSSLQLCASHLADPPSRTQWAIQLLLVCPLGPARPSQRPHLHQPVPGQNILTNICQPRCSKRLF